MSDSGKKKGIKLPDVRLPYEEYADKEKELTDLPLLKKGGVKTIS